MKHSATVLRPHPRSIWIAALLSLGAATGCGRTEIPEAVLREAIDARVPEVSRDRDWVRASLEEAYDGDDQPLWLGGDGLSDRGRRLLSMLERARVEGLAPEDYGVIEVREALGELAAMAEADSSRRMETLGNLEARLSVGLLAYARDLVRGRLDPDEARQDWRIGAEPLPPNLLPRLRGGEAFDDLLQGLRPRAPYYDRLVEALATLREVRERGGWPEVDAALEPRIGWPHEGIASLRARLRASEDPRERRLAGAGGDSNVFDADLAGALKRYQSRHGLEPDGELGPATLRELNTPVEARIDAVVLNLDRLRWLPRDLGERAIVVNVAGFEFALLEDDEPRMTMNVIVGRAEWATKLFTAKMDHLVFNPYWNVPESIVTAEILPAARQDPAYLARNGYEVLGPDGAVRNPAELTADGEAAGTGGGVGRGAGGTEIEERGRADGDDADRPLRVRQTPGPHNALGRVKFMFPNQYNIYLHDTPNGDLFRRSYRAFSHGCIRLERPVELAKEVVEHHTELDAADVDRMLESGETVTVELDRPLDVYIVYFTAWVDDDGTMHFYRDIYDRDDALRRMVALPRVGPDAH